MVHINDIKASFDQAQSTLRDLAPVIYSYYDSLRKQGFDPEQAFAMARDLHMAYISPWHYYMPEGMPEVGDDD